MLELAGGSWRYLCSKNSTASYIIGIVNIMTVVLNILTKNTNESGRGSVTKVSADFWRYCGGNSAETFVTDRATLGATLRRPAKAR